MSARKSSPSSYSCVSSERGFLAGFLPAPPFASRLSSAGVIGGHHPREAPDEALERLAVAAQRADRDPLPGPVVAVADRAELDGGHAGARNETASEAPSRPTLITRSGWCGEAASQSPRTKGESGSTTAGGRRKVARTRVSGRLATCSRISSGSWSGRKRMSTSMTQVSGTLFRASPPMIRPRLIEGRSNRAELWRANGSDSMPRNTSTAFTTALSPSHGVAPCAARPWTSRRIARTPFAWTPTWRLVGSPVIAKSPRNPPSTRASLPRFFSSSDSSSETIPSRSRTRSCSRRSWSTSSITARAPFMS